MFSLINIIIFLWLVRTIKAVLFWIYLWQLKEYHIGRFVDHFRTHKGKKLIFNFLLGIKIVLLPLIIIKPLLFIWILGLIYVFEFLIFGLQVIKNTIKKPVITSKTILLLLLSYGLVILFLAKAFYFQSYNPVIVSLLLFDILTPVIISVVVLLIQPLFVLARNSILDKARRKMATLENITVIGITGSYGKTSTKEFLKTILSANFKVLATPDHKNSEMGIAQYILSSEFDKILNQKTKAPKELGARPSTQIDLSALVFIVEMGAYQKGGISLLCDIVKPKIGMVTGVNEQHLATFGSLDNLLSAEGGIELLHHLPHDGTLVVNGENKYCMNLYKSADINKKLYTVSGTKMASDIFAEDVMITKDDVSFVAMTKEREAMHFLVNVLGKQNVQNLLGAILVAKELGMSLEEIAKASQNITKGQAGITQKIGIHGIAVIDSSYSSNPDGVMADLDYLNVFNGKKIIVMPCLIELGVESDCIHEEIGKKLAQICDVAIITTRDKFREISNGFMSQGIGSHKILFCDNPREISTMITVMCKEGDAVLLEGRVPSEVIKLLKSRSS